MMCKPVLLLCHGRKHSYKDLEAHFSDHAKQFTTMDICHNPDIMLDVTKELSDEQRVRGKFYIIASIFCPYRLFFARDKLNETFFKNVCMMLRPGGLFITRLHGYSLELSDELKELHHIPCSYDLPDISRFIKSKEITKYFDIKYLYQHKLGEGDSPFEGYVYTDANNKTYFTRERMPKRILNKCKQQCIDIEKWQAFNNKQLVVLKRK